MDRLRSILKNQAEFDFGRQSPFFQMIEIHRWMKSSLGLKDEDVYGCMAVHQSAGQVVRVKFIREEVFSDFLSKWEGVHSIELKGKRVDVKIYDASEIVTFVRIADIPFEIEVDRVAAHLSRFGRVKSIRRDVYKGEGFLSGYQGWITAALIMNKKLPSYLDIFEDMSSDEYPICKGIVKYDGQIPTCRECHEEGHRGVSCEWNARNIRRKRAEEARIDREMMRVEKEKLRKQREMEEKEIEEQKKKEKEKEREDAKIALEEEKKKEENRRTEKRGRAESGDNDGTPNLGLEPSAKKLDPRPGGSSEWFEAMDDEEATDQLKGRTSSQPSRSSSYSSLPGLEATLTQDTDTLKNRPAEKTEASQKQVK